ncbi:hypothetical protein L9F63_010162 [Diploptera punctata]|uniref:DNA/RNA non-specific endonuclease/pyrophosphatase/phosphodiesterase domain-containing protein n=1 Tax=Diploptera punctata TaxID=6984 RepID=A0AAD8AIM7_DIPPU|nr:hypothetical protein L9F63_010162 [Diploptera punctata]
MVSIFSLVHTIGGIPVDPRSFTFQSRRSTMSIDEQIGCFAPNEKSLKYIIRIHSDHRDWILYSLCYDKNLNIPAQSSHILSSVQERTISTPYSSEKFSNNLLTTPYEFYQCRYQLENFKSTLGFNQARKFINCNNGHFFAPGNLVPVSDFPFEQQRTATQYFINTFPQWKIIRDGNMKNLERSIRKYVKDSGNPLTVFGGTLGVTSLPSSAGREELLFMTRNTTNNPTVAAPKLVWKVIYDSHVFESIVFVIVNNPYRTNVVELFKNREVVCNCVCHETEGWFDGWDRLDFTKGYVYCCTWEEFHQTVGIDYLANTKLLRKKS